MPEIETKEVKQPQTPDTKDQPVVTGKNEPEHRD